MADLISEIGLAFFAIGVFFILASSLAVIGVICAIKSSKEK